MFSLNLTIHFKNPEALDILLAVSKTTDYVIIERATVPKQAKLIGIKIREFFLLFL